MEPRPPDTLDAPDWTTLDAALDAALALDGDARDAYVAVLDARLRAALAPLLRDALRDDPLLDYAGDALASLLVGDEAPSEFEGAHVGPYCVESLVGEGGMGRVYRAHRADGAFDQTVAVKVVRTTLALAGTDVSERLRRERAVLATLDHPGIARLIDGGETEDGVPYLVTEFVDGLPLTAWAEAHGLGVEARVRLVREVARAVDHAHRRFVVHRDLKPSNVLVTERDGTPRPVVLDFGIARLLDGAEGSGAFPQTQTGLRMLTPAYAAPELFESSATVTTAADVYGLGALLYELLAGRRPHDDAAGPATVEPARPSRVVTEAAEAPGALARARGLRGDLDVICLKALHPDPARRYASALAFADDLDRYLDGRPVDARPDSLAYVASRFARRHRPTVVAGLVALVALLTGLSVALVSLRAERATRADAERHAARATESADFLASLLTMADPTDAGGHIVTVREALDAGVHRMASVESRALRGYLAGALADTYARIGDVGLADSLFAVALESLRGVESLDDAAQVKLRIGRSATRAALGDHAGALALCRQARARLGPTADAALRLRADRALARSQFYAGERDEAAQLAERAVTDARRLGDVDDLIRTLRVAADVAATPEVGLTRIREAVRLSEQRHGPDAPPTLLVRHSQGEVLAALGRHARAEAVLRRVQRGHVVIFGDSTLAEAYLLATVGQGQLARDQLRRAAASLDSAVVMARLYLPDDHPDLAAWHRLLEDARQG